MGQVPKCKACLQRRDGFFSILLYLWVFLHISIYCLYKFMFLFLPTTHYPYLSSFYSANMLTATSEQYIKWADFYALSFAYSTLYKWNKGLCSSSQSFLLCSLVLFTLRGATNKVVWISKLIILYCSWTPVNVSSLLKFSWKNFFSLSCISGLW